MNSITVDILSSLPITAIPHVINKQTAPYINWGNRLLIETIIKYHPALIKHIPKHEFIYEDAMMIAKLCPVHLRNIPNSMKDKRFVTFLTMHHRQLSSKIIAGIPRQFRSEQMFITSRCQLHHVPISFRTESVIIAKLEQGLVRSPELIQHMINDGKISTILAMLSVNTVIISRWRKYISTFNFSEYLTTAEIRDAVCKAVYELTATRNQTTNAKLLFDIDNACHMLQQLVD